MSSPSSSPPPLRPTTHVTPFLAFDTSGPTARVALVDGAADGHVRCLFTAERVSDRHSGTLLPMCHALLEQAGLTVGGLAAIACGSGPGSFTGLRVGLAVAKGMALACDLPLLLVPSLTALAVDLAQIPGDQDQLLAPCIDAGKGEIYVQLFRRPPGAGGGSLTPEPLTAELRTTAAAFADQLLADKQIALFGGTGADRHRAPLQERLGVGGVLVDFPGPSARAVGQLALARLARGERDDLDAAVPVYGRPPDITTPKRPVLTR